MFKTDSIGVQRSGGVSKRWIGVVAISLVAAIVLGCGGRKAAPTAKQPAANSPVANVAGHDTHWEVCHSTALLTDAVDAATQVGAKRGVTSAELRAQFGDDLAKANANRVPPPAAGAKADDVKLYEQAHDYQESLDLVASYFKGESTDRSVLDPNSLKRRTLIDHWDAVCP